MRKTGKCIFCLNENASLTKEHIIPYGLGNRLFTLDCVCEDCNSKLGSELDNNISDSFVAKIFREQYGLKGHSGKTPVAFENGQLKDGTKIIRKNGKFVTKTKVEVDGDKVHISAPTIEEAVKIANGILKKRNKSELSKEHIEKIKQKDNSQKTGEIEYSFGVDIYIVILDLLKIIYETYVYFNGIECIGDAGLKSIRKAVYNYIINGYINETLINCRCMAVDEQTAKLFEQMDSLLSSSFPDDVIHILSFVKKEDCEIAIAWIKGALPFAFKIDISNEYSIDKMVFISKNQGVIEM